MNRIVGSGRQRPPSVPPANPISARARAFHRDQLRAARAAVHRDSEAYTEILFAVERLGATLLGRGDSLAVYRDVLSTLARQSVLACEVPSDQPAAHLTFERLFQLVREGRNDALHQGAVARHLSCCSTELALVLEDALMSRSRCIADYMVRAPLCAEGWQPLSLIRQHMLQNSFSYLPYSHEFSGGQEWLLLSDSALVTLLHREDGKNHRRRLLAMSLNAAVEERMLELVKPTTVSFHTSVIEALGQGSTLPILVLDDEKRRRHCYAL